MLQQVSVAPILPGWWLKYAGMRTPLSLMLLWDASEALRRGSRTYACGVNPLLTPPHTAVMQICSCEKMSVHELICSVWQSVEQEWEPVPLAGLRCQKVSEARAMLVLRDAAPSLPPSGPLQRSGSSFARGILATPPINASNVFAKTGRERRRGEMLPALSERALFSLVIYFS